MSVKSYSIAKIKQKIAGESDPKKRKKLRFLLDEMAEVYPDQSEIPDNPAEMFVTPKQWKSSELKRKTVTTILGGSFTGKTFAALSASHLTKKHIYHDFKSLNKAKLQEFWKFLSQYYSFTPLWVIGTEKSTLECLKSYDNEEYFKHANINYVEITESSSSGTSLIDHIKTYKNFLTVLYSIANSGMEGGTVIVDSASAILTAQHEIVRRVIMGVPKLRKEQGIMPRHWFWRNAEQEGMMFYARIIPMHFISTVKVIEQHNTDGEDIEKIKWWEETHKHLSSIVMKNARLDKKVGGRPVFNTTIEKCRPNAKLYNKVYKNLTMPKFMYNIFLNSKKKGNKSK